MALKNTTKHMEQLLEMLMIDLQKSDRNKTAAQRVRTNSIKFSKLAKVFRRESMDAINTVAKKKAKKKTKAVKTRKNTAAKSRPASRRTKRARA